jgi:transposase InsO family protein
MRLTPEQRRQMVKMVRKGTKIKDVAELFGVSRQTVWRWCKRAKHRGRESFRDLPRKPKRRKITQRVEDAIVALRTVYRWGTARIQQALFKLPKFMRVCLSCSVQGVRLSRTAINGVLKAYGLNGYGREQRAWKFFRAKCPDELWQVDIKGPFWFHGLRLRFLVNVDDFSRYLLLFERFDHEPSAEEITEALDRLRRTPEAILSDNGPQFHSKHWEEWCRGRGIEPKFAHPRYPQDKGKVERAKRNLTQEFLNPLRKFPEWLDRLRDYQRWYNRDRFHRGVNTQPAKLYPVLV